MKIAELKIPAYHQRPISPTNLTLHQALDLNVPIGCGDTAVFPGDIIVGDDDCVIVIPAYLTEEIVEEAVEMTAACRFCRGESSKRSIHHWTLSSYKRGESGGVCKVAREEWPLGFILSNQSRNI